MSLASRLYPVILLGVAGPLLAEDKFFPFTAISLTMNHDGKCKLTVDTRKEKDSHLASSPKGKPIELTLFGQAAVSELPEDRLLVTYDFKKFKDNLKLKANFLSPEYQKAFEKQVGIDVSEGVLVLKPNDQKWARWILPWPISGSIDLSVHLAPVKQGMFQIHIQSGIDWMEVNLHGQNSLNPPGTVIVSHKTEKKFDNLLMATHRTSSKKMYDFNLKPAFASNRSVSIAYRGDFPLAIPRIELEAKFRSIFGVHLVERSGKVVVDRVFENGFADKAGIKEGDVLVKINSLNIKNVSGAIKILSEIGLTKDAMLEIERYGRLRTIKITNQ